VRKKRVPPHERKKESTYRKNFENRSTFAKVIVKHQVAYFFGTQLLSDLSSCNNFFYYVYDFNQVSQFPLLAAAACQISYQSDRPYTDLKIGLFEFFVAFIWLEMPMQAPKMGGFGGLWTPKAST